MRAKARVVIEAKACIELEQGRGYKDVREEKEM